MQEQGAGTHGASKISSHAVPIFLSKLDELSLNLCFSFSLSDGVLVDPRISLAANCPQGMMADTPFSPILPLLLPVLQWDVNQWYE